jgi:hypothetical protein
MEHGKLSAISTALAFETKANKTKDFDLPARVSVVYQVGVADLSIVVSEGPFLLLLMNGSER